MQTYLGSFRSADRFAQFYRISTLSLVLVCVPVTAVADFFGDQVGNQLESAPVAEHGPIDAEAGRGNFSLNFLPLPVVDPTLGTGLALVGLATFRVDPEDVVSPRSTVAVSYARTNYENEAIGGGGQLFFGEDRYRVDFLVAAADLNFDFFGLGGDSLAGNSIPFSFNGYVARLGAAVRVVPNTFVGVRAIYADIDIGIPSERPILGRLRVNVELSGLGPFVTYDSRDSTWYPTSGTQARLEVTRFEEILRTDKEFNLSEGTLSHYISLGVDTVLAGNVRVAYASENAPFFLYPFVSIRGFPAFRFLGQTVTQAETEVRWFPFRSRSDFLSDIGVVAFGGGGIAARDFGDLRDEPVAYAGGFGVRYNISKEDGINVGLDVAWGRDNETGFYFRIGEAF